MGFRHRESNRSAGVPGIDRLALSRHEDLASVRQSRRHRADAGQEIAPVIGIERTCHLRRAGRLVPPSLGREAANFPRDFLVVPVFHGGSDSPSNRQNPSFAMKNPRLFLLPLVLVSLLSLSRSGESAEASGAAREAQLQKWLARFPEADSDADGKLTMEEATAFREKMTTKRQADKNAARAAIPAPTHADVRYGDHERNVFDLWLPEKPADSGAAPVHVYFHGGGFVAGDKSKFDPRPFLDAGFAAASGNYRFVDGVETLSPAPMEDAARVIQTLKFHAAEWGLDPERISVSGSSAGAVITMWIGYLDDRADPGSEDPIARQSTRVHCIAPLNGPTNLDPAWIRSHLGGPPHIHGSLPKMLGTNTGFDHPEVRKRIDASNPWMHLSPDDPPTLMVYGGELEPIPLPETVTTGHLIHHPAFGVALKERLDEIGIANELHTGTDPRGTNLVVDWLRAQYANR